MDEEYEELLLERIHLLENRVKELEGQAECELGANSLFSNKNFNFFNRLKIGTLNVYRKDKATFLMLLTGIFAGYMYLFYITKLTFFNFNSSDISLIYHIVLAGFFSFSITLLVLFNLSIIKRRKAIDKKQKAAIAAAGVGSVASSFGASVGVSAAAPTFGAVCSTAVAPELATLGSSAGSIAASQVGSSNILGSSISTSIIAIAVIITLISLMSISKKL